jgi:hypothetical protein
MLRWGNTREVRALVTASSLRGRDADLDRRYAAAPCSVIRVTIPLPCNLVTSRTARVGRLIAHR